MKIYLTALSAWGRAHKPFLRLITLIILVGLAANVGFRVYASVVISRLEAQDDRRTLEMKAYSELAETLVFYEQNPKETKEITANGTHFRMKKISDASSPNNTWHMVGWQEADDGELYRLEECFAAPAVSENLSN